MNTEVDVRLATGSLTVDVDALRRVLPVLKKIAGGRVPVPSLGWVRFADGAVSAFDFDTSVTAHVGVGDLAGAVRFADFAPAVAILPKRGTVEMTSSEDGSSITLGAVRVPAQDMADLPSLPDMSSAGHVVTLAPAHMAEALRVAVAASTDYTQPVLCNVQVLALDEHAFTLASTDRYRLHHAHLTGSVGLAAGNSVLLDAKALALVGRAMKGQDVKISCIMAQEFVSYRSESVEITSRGSQSEFPRWGALVPSEVETFDVNRAELLSAVKAAGKILLHSTPARLEGNAQGLDVVAYVDNVETLRMPVSAEGVPADFAAGFNPGYLVQALDVLTGDTVTVGFNDPKRPHTFTDAQSATETLVMPVRFAS